jgi:hypothetical protein
VKRINIDLEKYITQLLDREIFDKQSIESLERIVYIIQHLNGNVEPEPITLEKFKARIIQTLWDRLDDMSSFDMIYLAQIIDELFSLPEQEEQIEHTIDINEKLEYDEAGNIKEG